MEDPKKRWGAWAADFFRKENKIKQKIEHIHDLGWGEDEIQTEDDLKMIRKKLD